MILIKLFLLAMVILSGFSVLFRTMCFVWMVRINNLAKRLARERGYTEFEVMKAMEVLQLTPGSDAHGRGFCDWCEHMKALAYHMKGYDLGILIGVVVNHRLAMWDPVNRFFDHLDPEERLEIRRGIDHVAKVCHSEFLRSLERLPHP